jgi:hypothetical protein
MAHRPLPVGHLGAAPSTCLDLDGEVGRVAFDVAIVVLTGDGQAALEESSGSNPITGLCALQQKSGKVDVVVSK